MEQRCTKCKTVRNIQYWFRYKTNNEIGKVRKSHVCLMCYRRSISGNCTEEELIESDKLYGRDTMRGCYLRGQPRLETFMLKQQKKVTGRQFVIDPSIRAKSWPLVDTKSAAVLSEMVKQPSGKDRLS